MLHLFNGASVRDDIDPAEIEALSDDLRAVLTETMQHCLAAQTGEARFAAARVAVRDLMHAYDAALAAFNSAQRPTTHAEALRAVIAAGQPGYRPKKSSKTTPEQDALDSASVALAEARAELERASADYKALSAKRADAVMRWINANPEKMTPDTLRRQHAQAQQQHRIDVAAGKVPAPKIAEPVRQNEIDRVLSARGRARVR